MRLYHGSSRVVQLPDVAKSRSNLDFGRGFYTTSIRGQPQTWARRKAALEKGEAYVNEYELDEGKLAGRAILRFSDPDERWVRFVCDCRRGGDAFRGYDLVVGGVANDRVYYAVDMFYQGLWDIGTTLEALRYYEVNDQWCFISQSLVDDALRFVGASEVDAS